MEVPIARELGYFPSSFSYLITPSPLIGKARSRRTCSFFPLRCLSWRGVVSPAVCTSGAKAEWARSSPSFATVSAQHAKSWRRQRQKWSSLGWCAGLVLQRCHRSPPQATLATGRIYPCTLTFDFRNRDLTDPAKATRLLVGEGPGASQEVGQTRLGASIIFH